MVVVPIALLIGRVVGGVAPFVTAASFVPIAQTPPASAPTETTRADPKRATADAVVVQRHPVELLLAAQPELRSISLAPARPSGRIVEPESSANEPRSLLDRDSLVELVNDCVRPRNGYYENGTNVEVDGEDLVVTATAEMQEQVTAFLAQLERTLVPSATLEVRVLSPASPSLSAGVRAIAVADRQIAEAKASGVVPVRTLRLPLRDAVAQYARTGSTTSIVSDWEVQIAHAMSVAGPVVSEAFLGLELVARSARVDGGTLLELVARESERGGADDVRHFEATNFVLSQTTQHDTPAAAVVTAPRVAFASIGGTFLLPDGDALLLPCRVDTVSGRTSFALDLRVVGEQRPARASFAISPAEPDGEPRQLDLATLGLASLGGVAAAPPDDRLLDNNLYFDTDVGQFGTLASVKTSRDDLVEMIEHEIHFDLDSNHGRIGWLSGRIACCAPSSVAKGFDAALASWTTIPASLVVEAEIADRSGRRLADFSALLLDGKPFTVWSGREQCRVVDWDCDVACFTNAVNPNFEPCVDGFALQLRAGRSATGGLDLQVDGTLHFLEAPPQLRKLGDASHLEIDATRARTLALHEARTLPADGGRVELGGGDLVLRVAVRPDVASARANGAGATAGGTTKAKSADASGVVERHIPLANLWWRAERDDSARSVAMLPLHRSDRGSDTEFQPLFSFDTLVDAARSPTDAAVWNEPDHFLAIEDGTLIVRAPAEAAAAVANEIARIANRFAPSQTLDVRIVGADGGELRALHVGLRDRMAQHAAIGTSETFLRDWEIQICGTTEADKPVVDECFTGLELSLRSEATANGTLLSLALREAETAAATATTRPCAVARMTAEESIVERLQVGVVDEPRVGFLAFATTLFVPDGEVVRVPCRVDTTCGPQSFTLELQVSGRKPPLSRLPGSWLLANEKSGPDWPTLHQFEDEWWADVHGKTDDAEGGLFVRPIAITSPTDESDDLASVRAAGVTIDATIVDANGHERATFRVPALGGRRVALWSGVEGMRLARWDCDVANECSGMNPDCEPFLDGFALVFEASQDVGGTRGLRVVGSFSGLDALPSPRELDDVSHLSVEELHAQRQHVDQFVTLPRDGGTVELGGDPLTLRLRCTPIEQ